MEDDAAPSLRPAHPEAVPASRPPRPDVASKVLLVLSVLCFLGVLEFVADTPARSVPVALVVAACAVALLWGGSLLRREARLEITLDPPARWDWTDIVLAIPAGLACGGVVGILADALVVNVGGGASKTTLTALENAAADIGSYAGILIAILLMVVVRRGASIRDLGWRLPRSGWWLLAAVVIGAIANQGGPPILGVVPYVGIGFAVFYIAFDRLADWPNRPEWAPLAMGLGGLAMASLVAVVINKLTVALPAEAAQQCQNVQNDFNGAAAIAVLAVAVITPIVEETAFRGFIYGWLRQRIAVTPAAAISGVVFGISHANLVLLLPLSIFGIMLALIAERSRSILPTMVVHASFNLVGVLALISAPSCS